MMLNGRRGAASAAREEDEDGEDVSKMLKQLANFNIADSKPFSFKTPQPDRSKHMAFSNNKAAVQAITPFAKM